MNQFPRTITGSKFNFQMKLQPNPQRLSLSQKPIRNLSTKKVKNLALPGIGQMFVMDMIKNRSQNKENQRRISQNAEKSSSMQHKRIFASVYQKVLKQNKDYYGNNEQRISLNLIKNSCQQGNQVMKNDSKSMQNQGPEQRQESMKKNIQIRRKLSLKKAESICAQVTNNLSNMVDATVQTLEFDEGRLSYVEYLKFRITQKQTFQKFQHLFGYVQNLAELQQQNRHKHQTQYQSIFTSKIDDRQKRVQELMNDVQSSSQIFKCLFKKIQDKQGKIVRDCLTNQQDLYSIMKLNLKKAQERILQIMIEKEIFNQAITPKEIKGAFEITLKNINLIIEENSQILSQKMSDCYKIERQLQQSYKQWETNVAEQYKLIQNCVINIMQLPEMSMHLFGFQGLADHHQTNNDIKRYCFNTEKVPHISDFFVKKDHPREKEINEVFRKCCDIKCLNCVYLRSKMVFIYDKNKELKPVIKALMQLVNTDYEKIKLQRRISRKG